MGLGKRSLNLFSLRYPTIYKDILAGNPIRDGARQKCDHLGNFRRLPPPAKRRRLCQPNSRSVVTG